MNTASIKSCVAALAAAAALSASADLLYWTVSDATFDKNSGMEGSPASFDYATVSVDGGVTHLNVYDQSGDTGYWKLYANEEGGRSADPVYSGQFDSGAASSLLVELWDASDQKVGWQTYRMSSIIESVWKDSDPGGKTGATALVVQGVVPEPTSGMLVLVGAALLALRRRRGALGRG